MAYHVGDVARLTAVFTDEQTGAAVDPTTVAFVIRPPHGPHQTVTPARTAVGTFGYELAITAAGDWIWRAVGTGTAQAAQESAFTVEYPTF